MRTKFYAILDPDGEIVAYTTDECDGISWFRLITSTGEKKRALQEHGYTCVEVEIKVGNEVKS